MTKIKKGFVVTLRPLRNPKGEETVVIIQGRNKSAVRHEALRQYPNKKVVEVVG